jgi:hypothetical protein
MKNADTDNHLANLPVCAAQFIRLVIRKMRYRKKVRADVQAELIAHFEDALKDCPTDEQKQQKAEKLISHFGDAGLLAVLARRAKKRCRPLWRKVLIRSLQVIGVYILYVAVRIGYLHTGSPTISVDYVKWLNEFVQAGRDQTDNAMPYYEKAEQAYVQMPDWLQKTPARWVTDLDSSQRKELAEWLASNAMALELFREGAAKPACWARYESKTGVLLGGVVCLCLPDYPRLARTMSWQARSCAAQGNLDAALSDCILLYKSGRQFQGKKLLIDQLRGKATEMLASSTAFEILSRTNPTDDQLQWLQQQLDQLVADAVGLDFEVEKAYVYDCAQRSFTDDGKGSGRILPRPYGAMFAGANGKSILLHFLTIGLPSRRKALTEVDAYFGQMERVVNEPGSLLEKQDYGCKSLATSNLYLLNSLVPVYLHLPHSVCRNRVQTQALLTTIAILRYERQTGRLPADLKELSAAGYLNALPIDPYSGKPLVYKQVDGDFMLYSFGADFDDDGGTPGKKWDERGGDQPGDQVFWPLQTEK